jgi:ABC-type spermidine/putrescine transport system permease subunit II
MNYTGDRDSRIVGKQSSTNVAGWIAGFSVILIIIALAIILPIILTSNQSSSSSFLPITSRPGLPADWYKKYTM